MENRTGRAGKSFRRLAVLTAAVGVLLGLHSCRPDRIVVDSPEKRSFLNATDYGFYREGRPVLLYDAGRHQFSLNPRRNQYRIQTEDQTELGVCGFDAQPRSVGLNVLTRYRLITGEPSGELYLMMECSRISRDAYWFWNAENSLGIIVPAGTF